MKTSLLTAVIGTLLAGTALAAPGTPAGPGTAPAPLSVQEIFGDALRLGLRQGALIEGIRIAGCPTGSAPVCKREEVTYESVCIGHWSETSDGVFVCSKWDYKKIVTCAEYMCGDPH